MSQKINLEIVERCNDLCDQRDKAITHRDKLLKACKLVGEAKHNLEKVIAYCKTDDATLKIGKDLEELVLYNLLAAAIAGEET